MTDSVSRPSSNDYGLFLDSLKDRVRSAQTLVRRSVNTQLIGLYWSIGRDILTRQEEDGWGPGVIGRLAQDLHTEFPTMKGLSRSNLSSMRSFAYAWPAFDLNVPQPVGHLPWGHIRTILDKKLNPDERDWYATAAVEHGWSRNVLMNMIMNKIMNKTLERSGSAPSNSAQQLVMPNSELAQQIAKDPYNFDFLGLTGEVAERDLEQRLMDRMVETLRELGTRLAFVGRQMHFDVDGDDFYLDLLFFHVEQLRYVVIELKTGNSNLTTSVNCSSTSHWSRTDSDGSHAPTVGILVCGSRKDHTVRYALNQAGSPMAVSTYTYDGLPSSEKAALPSEEELTTALD